MHLYTLLSHSLHPSRPRQSGFTGSRSVFPNARHWFAGVLLPFSLLVLTACQRLPELGPPQPRPVRVIALSGAQTIKSVELSGEVRPRIESRLGFQVGGRLAERRVDLGQRVKAGDVLARIDPSDLKLQESAARSQLAAARTEAEQAGIEYRRTLDLRSKNFVSQAEVDRRKAALDASQARVDALQSQLSVQTNQARYTDLIAPTDGFITGLDVEVGQVVGPGVPVLRLAASRDMEVAVSIPEGRLQEVRDMGRATVRFWTDGEKVAARLREISSMADPLTRSFHARLTLESVPDNIRYGMSAVALFERKQNTDGFKIPLTALFAEEGKSWVFVLDDKEGKVNRINIIPHDVDGNQFVIRDGLSDGQLVVVAGTHLLKDGQAARRFIEPVSTKGETKSETSQKGTH